MAFSVDMVKAPSPTSLPSPVWTFRDETPAKIRGLHSENDVEIGERPLKRIKWTIPADFPKGRCPPTVNSLPTSYLSSFSGQLSGNHGPDDIVLGCPIPALSASPFAFPQSTRYPNISWPLPSFLKPLPPNFSSEDVRYLSAKGALSIPEHPLRMALLQAFVEHVHPYMPVLDLFGFLGAIDDSQTQRMPEKAKKPSKISLLLFQAVMFSATAFVDVKHLYAAGFASRKEARRRYFQKTRSLYDLDYEPDRVILIQVLLLMTFWHETLDDEKDAWHWIGVAVSLAETIGMSHFTGPAKTKKQKLWRRLWWVCFVQDQLVVLGLRRSARIDRKKFKAPPLEESDFDIQSLETSYSVLPQQCVLVKDKDMQREIALAYIAKARLCSSLSRMLELQYSMQPRVAISPDSSNGSLMMLSPHPSIEENAADELDFELKEWSNQLPSSCQYQIPTRADIENGRVAITLQRTLLHLLYHTAVITLHRPWAQAGLEREGVGRAYSRFRIVEAAASVGHIASDLKSVGAEGLLPATGVTILMQALMTHLVDMKDQLTTKTYQNAVRGFKQCTSVLECLRETYSSADVATEIIHAALAAQRIVKSQSSPSMQPKFGQLTPESQNEWLQDDDVGADLAEASNSLTGLTGQYEDVSWLDETFEDALMALADATYADPPFSHDECVGDEPKSQETGSINGEEVVKEEKGVKLLEVEVES